MRLVDKCDQIPHRCSATQKSEDPQGFVDTGMEPPCIDPHIYLSVSWVRNELAALCGLVDGDTHAALGEELEQARRDLESKQLELDAVNRELDAISVIESSERFKARRKPGPRKKVAA